MRVLVIGSGGREHALAWKLIQSPDVTSLIVAPGNAGTARTAGIENVPIAADDIPALLELAEHEQVGLTIVGPEVPLVAGIVDTFQDRGLACLGPGRDAAALEGSKSFAKAFMARHGIPTAAYAEFTDLDAALSYLADAPVPIVVKADGLAAGKGVVVAKTREEAITAAKSMLAEARFGDAGQRIVIEEFLAGEEASFIVLTDGHVALPMATSQDHKARDNGDLGPNTGGMGAYSPAPIIDEARHSEIMAQIIEPTLAGLRAEGMHYCGFLYAGLMIAPDGSMRVLEFNCRFGDPETQPIMARLTSDLAQLCNAALNGTLAEQEVQWDPRPAVGVVMAAGGYPESYASGAVIDGIEAAEAAGTLVFHAGTSENEGKVVTAGGRVLCVVGRGDTVAAAKDCAYRGVKLINWDNVYWRSDIAHRALAQRVK